MSHRANYWLAQLAPERVKPGAFRVLFHLCDHHNDERDPRRACFPSQETLRERTGMANGTLNAALAQLETDGLIRRIRSTIPGQATRRTYYVMECDFDRMDEQTPKSGVSPNSGEPESAPEQTPVLEQANSGFEGGKLRPTGEEPVRNRKGKDVCSADAAQHTNPEFEDFWQAYPRPKDREATELAFAQAVADGADPAALVAAARAYRDENRGNGRMYLKHSANWLREGAWRDHAPTAKPKASGGDVAAFWAEQVKARAFIPASAISPGLAHHMVEVGLVTPDDLKAVGVAA